MINQNTNSASTSGVNVDSGCSSSSGGGGGGCCYNIVTDHSQFLSKRGLLKKPSPIREIISISSLPGMISLGGGLPNPSTFPFKSITVELNDEKSTRMSITGNDLNQGLQYSPTSGLPNLNKWLKDLQIQKHSLGPCDQKGKEWNLLITTGSQEALAMAMEVLLNDGDSIITENPTYSGTLSILNPMALNIIGIETDEFGMKSEILNERLENFNSHYPGKLFPKILYCIPTGQNPGGSTMNEKRKKEIYSIASKYNLLILEDDPYYYLQYTMTGPCGNDLGKSFLSMDTDNRVLRFDSLSKILSSGLRIGFLTGASYLLQQIQYHQQATTLHASGISQVITEKLLTGWGLEKWDAHIRSVQLFYMEKRNQFIRAIQNNPSLLEKVKYNIPNAGMFFWIQLLGVSDTKSLIQEKALEKKVILLPGSAFSTNTKSPSSFVRASFSIATEDQMNEALKRLSDLF